MDIGHEAQMSKQKWFKDKEQTQDPIDLKKKPKTNKTKQNKIK